MKAIIAGSRTIDKMFMLELALADCPWRHEITEVVSGGARGADRLGETMARAYNLPVKLFEAKWEKYGRKAGPMRNREMAEYADGLIALWDGKSSGTLDMIRQMRYRGKPIIIRQFQVETPPQ